MKVGEKKKKEMSSLTFKTFHKTGKPIKKLCDILGVSDMG